MTVTAKSQHRTPAPELGSGPEDSDRERFGHLVAELVGEVAAERDLDPGQARAALYRLLQGASLQERQAHRAREAVVRSLSPSIEVIDPVPRATVQQALRLAALQASLLQGGAYSIADIAGARGISAEAARQWASRQRRAGRLFTVSHAGEAWVPAFLLDDRFVVKTDAAPAITALRAAGEDGWALWAWFAAPSPWLGGEVPAEVLATRPSDVYEAARQRAATS